MKTRKGGQEEAWGRGSLGEKSPSPSPLWSTLQSSYPSEGLGSVAEELACHILTTLKRIPEGKACGWRVHAARPVLLRPPYTRSPSNQKMRTEVLALCSLGPGWGLKTLCHIHWKGEGS